MSVYNLIARVLLRKLLVRPAAKRGVWLRCMGKGSHAPFTLYCQSGRDTSSHFPPPIACHIQHTYMNHSLDIPYGRRAKRGQLTREGEGLSKVMYLQFCAVKAVRERSRARACTNCCTAAQRKRSVNCQREPLLRQSKST